jgi:DNA topoisomerase-1
VRNAFKYIDPQGRTIRNADTISRIKSLVLPPAWQDVWICTDTRGHLQATGKDERGRIQYRYHPKWREARDETKYGRMMAFGKALPKIRRRIARDMKKPGLPRERVLAAVVKLLETTLIRVGNEEYARDNGSVGLTTMKDKHADISGGTVHFEFKGKSGVKHAIDLEDKRLARIVKQCQDVPGYDLFQYIDAKGTHHPITSTDVNAYLKDAAGQEFTAKDFRTWAGTVLAYMALREFEEFDSETQAKKNVLAAIETVAAKLGNTKAVCRKCYVHPAVLDTYLSGELAHTLEQRAEEEFTKGLHRLKPEEAAVLTLLRSRLAKEAKKPRDKAR